MEDVDREISCKKGTIARVSHHGAYSASLTGTLNKEANRFEESLIGNRFCGDRKMLKPEDDCSSILEEDFASSFMS